ncbi:MAG: DNA repair protein RadA [Candidatus Sericytochromatia bacterium]|nr:DNA repair protein RadA [Candidatus Sericytochromatia bacterium]
MAKQKSKYVCQACGAEQARWFGKCPDCQAWNTLVEELVTPVGTGRAGTASGAVRVRAVPMAEVALAEEERFPTGLSELDRVLGGGVVPGSLVLLGGDPGIGKSTLLLQVAQNIAASGLTVLYASGEESAKQIRLRAKRLNAEHANLHVLAETDIHAIEGAIRDLRPSWAVIDSIQAVYDAETNSLPGSVSQVRAATGCLLKLAKEEGIALCLVGHVTKEGTLAGPRVLEHMVDTVLYFEGDRFKSHRLIRGVKNRYGATNEVGVFEMETAGLREVLNPSELFLAERAPDASGSAIVATMEGTRPLLVEVQALVSPSALAQPRRSATGLEYNRLVQILAVLEKRVGLSLAKADAYLNVVGGLDIGEPAADLAVALAIASSLRDVPLPADLVALGEIGLNGEIRAVSGLEARLKEAAKLGFKTALVPKHNLGSVPIPPELRVVGVTRLMESILRALGVPDAAESPEPDAASEPPSSASRTRGR